MKKAGFQIKDTHLVQPTFASYEQKIKLLEVHLAYKQTALSGGKSEALWAAEKQELIRLAKDEFSFVAFYQSCQVCGQK